MSCTKICVEQKSNTCQEVMISRTLLVVFKAADRGITQEVMMSSSVDHDFMSNASVCCLGTADHDFLSNASVCCLEHNKEWSDSTRKLCESYWIRRLNALCPFGINKGD